jgi:hypothetical protein
MNTEALTVTTHASNAVTYHRQATDAAGAIRDFALKRCVKIGPKSYPPVEVWQAVANSLGCVASAGSVEEIKGGIRAIGEVRRISDGQVIATGEGFVGDDEPTWAKRPMFARRAMAQTRSISRACRAAFAFVVPLIDSGLATTPAEEMEGVTDVEPVASIKPAQATEIRAVPFKPPTSVAQPAGMEGLIFTDRLSDISERQGQSAKGPWTAWFLKFANREESIGTFSQTLGDAAKALQGNDVKVTAKAGRKPGQWELVNIEPAIDDVPM